MVRVMNWLKRKAPSNQSASNEPQRPAQLPRADEPCWCGSGLEYQSCHYWPDAEEQLNAAGLHACDLFK